MSVLFVRAAGVFVLAVAILALFVSIDGFYFAIESYSDYVALAMIILGIVMIFPEILKLCRN